MGFAVEESQPKFFIETIILPDTKQLPCSIRKLDVIITVVTENTPKQHLDRLFHVFEIFALLRKLSSILRNLPWGFFILRSTQNEKCEQSGK
ncbi:hypothetical protein FGO68_gene13305 [Halteria grandinella]|uniref:Uncharacterized protein n=1 Tax=Halteria grandinella TaxID=5974 RepID=A0A8J8NAS5_HALGN|nr:hypothetical protein FGO68_gene13305 [Halteria grandinella]